MTIFDVDREDDVSSLDDVSRIDATIVSAAAALAANRAELAAHARSAARALVASETPPSDLRDAVARVAEQEAILDGLRELRIVAKYHGLEKLAADADKAAEALLVQADALEARLVGIDRGEIDLGPESELSDIPRMDALHFGELERSGVLARRTMMLEDAMHLRNERSKLKRAHADLFAAEGIV